MEHKIIILFTISLIILCGCLNQPAEETKGTGEETTASTLNTEHPSKTTTTPSMTLVGRKSEALPPPQKTTPTSEDAEFVAEYVPGFTGVEDTTVINGKVAIRDRYSGYMFYDGKKYGREGYQVCPEDVLRPKELDGDPVYVLEGHTGMMLMHGDRELARYDSIDETAVINGKLAYIAFKERKYLLIYDGKEIIETDRISDLTDVNGKLAYVIERWNPVNGNNVYIRYEGKEIGTNYVNAVNPVAVNGKLAYGAYDGANELVVYDGKEVKIDSGNYLDSIFDVNGKLTYTTHGDDDTCLVVDWSKVACQQGIKDPIEVNGKIAYYTLSSPPGWTDRFYLYKIVYDGKEIGTEYENRCCLMKIGGKLAYGAKDEKGWLVRYQDGKEIGERYDSVQSPMEIDGKLAYIAMKDNKCYIVRET